MLFAQLEAQEGILASVPSGNRVYACQVTAQVSIWIPLQYNR